MLEDEILAPPLTYGTTSTAVGMADSGQGSFTATKSQLNFSETVAISDAED